MGKYKLINEKLNKGVWVRTTDLLQLIKICYDRNNTYYKKLIEWYEYLENEKFELELINKNEKNKGQF